MNRIIFPSDYGLKIVTYTKELNWEIIDNPANYVPAGNRQVSPKGTDSPGVIGVPFCPNLAGFDVPIEIRVVVVGQIEAAPGETSESVGAYIDLAIEK